VPPATRNRCRLFQLAHTAQGLEDVHEIARNSEDRLEPVSQFSYREVDRLLGFEDEDDKISFSDASAAMALILQWMCGTSRGLTKGNGKQSPIVSAGVLALALLFLLDPTNARYESTPQIAEAAGVTRSAVNKALMVLRDQLGGILPLRGTIARENYRKAQLAAVGGRHPFKLSKSEKQLAGRLQ
jgi:hypothetical protein